MVSFSLCVIFFFFFQAEDGIRDVAVTGVQTCALPICGNEPGYREGVPERLGHYDLDAPPKLLWVHAVSVGEARAAAPLVRALTQALPDHHVLVTCTTAAGRETVKQVYGETVLAAYLPYDLPES